MDPSRSITVPYTDRTILTAAAAAALVESDTSLVGSTLAVADTGSALSTVESQIFGVGFEAITVTSGSFAGTQAELLDPTLHFAAGSSAQLSADAQVERRAGAGTGRAAWLQPRVQRDAGGPRQRQQHPGRGRGRGPACRRHQHSRQRHGNRIRSRGSDAGHADGVQPERQSPPPERHRGKPGKPGDLDPGCHRARDHRGPDERCPHFRGNRAAVHRDGQQVLAQRLLRLDCGYAGQPCRTG